ncbi:MAG: Hsp20/alpha crystallin family protein [Gemmatimonadota bacterium]
MMLPTRRGRTPTVLRTRPEFGWDLDRWFDDFFRRPTLAFAPGGPEADLRETEDEFILDLDLPGYDRDDIEVTVEKGVLSVSGERSSESEEESGTYHIRERGYGRFTRSFSVPQTVDPKKVEADFRRGVLHVRLPKAPEAKARRIEVKAD